MRLENSIKNTGISFITNIIKLIISFFLRRIFLLKLGEDYLGLNGLLVNVISMFSLVDMGIGSAIGYSLYKPLFEKNVKEIATKMNFFKNVYKIIAGIIFCMGIVFFPFIQNLFKNNITINLKTIKIAYILFVLDTGISYLLSYKKILLEADQKSYLLNIINTGIFIVVSICQYISLIIYSNFLLYLFIKIIFNFINNYIAYKIVDEKYSYLKKYKKLRILSSDKKDIYINTKALILHKIGDVCINSTDNIIIAKYINIGIVGLFSNYMLIITTVQGIIIQIFSSLTSILGNLIVEEKEKAYEMFKVLNLLGFIIFGLITTTFYNTIGTFIKLWIGDIYIIKGLFLIVITINLYVTGMRIVTGTVKAAAGYYTQDKYAPLIQSIINLFFSILLVQKYQLVGVVLGTLISSLIPTLYRPYILYKLLFKKKLHLYLIDYIKYALLTLLAIVMVNILKSKIIFQMELINFFKEILFSIGIFLLLAYMGTFKSEEFNYLKKNIIKKIGEKLWKKKFQ